MNGLGRKVSFAPCWNTHGQCPDLHAGTLTKTKTVLTAAALNQSADPASPEAFCASSCLPNSGALEYPFISGARSLDREAKSATQSHQQQVAGNELPVANTIESISLPRRCWVNSSKLLCSPGSAIFVSTSCCFLWGFQRKINTYKRIVQSWIHSAAVFCHLRRRSARIPIPFLAVFVRIDRSPWTRSLSSYN
jgi:hypothetical protein